MEKRRRRSVVLVLLLTPLLVDSAYQETDYLIKLTPDNFDNIVVTKSNGFAINFYVTWCGHCQTFAPIWTKMAHSTNKWGSFVKVAFMGCDSDATANVFCSTRLHNIVGYPYMGYLGVGKNISQFQNNYALHKTDAEDAAIELARMVVADLETSDPHKAARMRPHLGPAGFLRTRSNVDYVIYVVQTGSPDDVLGAMIYMDMSHEFDRLDVVVVTGEYILAKECKSAVPSVIISKPEMLSCLFSSQIPMSRYAILQAIADITHADNPLNHKSMMTSTNPPTQKREMAEPNTIFNHAKDLKSGISNILLAEVPSIPTMTPQVRRELASFIYNLYKYIDIDRNLTSFLNDLHEYLQSSNAPLTNTEFTGQILALQTKYPDAISNQLNWIACRSTVPGLRGFPCSVWMLGHTMTVKRALDRETPPKNGDYADVPWSFYRYIDNFFSCAECRKNFGKKAAKMRDEIHSHEDAVLWLWNSHNNANYWLKGTATEDPAFPKNPFPYPAKCKNCRTNNDTFNNQAVLAHLLSFYSDVKIFHSDVMESSSPPNSGTIVHCNGNSFLLVALLTFIMQYFFFWVDWSSSSN